MISERLKAVILKELELDDWDITEATRAPDVPGWDSLSHARIISAVEHEYGLRLSTAVVLRLATVGELQRVVAQQAARE